MDEQRGEKSRALGIYAHAQSFQDSFSNNARRGEQAHGHRGMLRLAVALPDR
jgi:hypothetical protein